MLNVRDIPRYEAVAEFAARYPEMDPVASEAFILLLHMGGQLHQLVEQRLAKYGISHGRHLLLALLNRDPDKPMAASALASRLTVTKQTMTALLEGLEADGLISRTRDESDRRVSLVQMTPAGRKLLTRTMPEMFELHIEAMRGLTREEQRMLAGLVRKAYESAMRTVRGVT
jgi:DNA-binding MarR family transcriptional regulator